PDAGERLPEPSRTQVGKEGHAVMRLKPTPRSCRIDAGVEDVRRCPALERVAIDRIHQWLQPIRDAPARLQRTASLARTKPRRQGITRPRKELHVLQLRFASGTSGSAEDSGRTNSHHEEALKSGVPVQEGLVHRLL